MEIQHLRYFYEVARQGSFSAAAKSMRISQPSISKVIKTLEDGEGVTFFSREKRGVRLTPMGKMLQESCERIFGEFNSIQQELGKRKNECRGELWLGASDNLCNYVFPEVLANFLERYPKISVKLLSGTAPETASRLRDFQIETGFFYSETRDPLLVVRKLFEVEFLAVARKDKAKLFKVNDSSLLPFIGSRASEYVGAYPALRMLKSLGVESASTFETNNQETQKRMVMEGLGFSLLPAHVVSQELARKELVRLPVKGKVTSPVYLATRRGKPLSPLAEEWIELLRKVVAMEDA